MPADPGAGVKRMKPKGLEAAASSASQTSTPSSCAYIAISLTSAMLTCLKVFSISLDSSATSVVRTGTVVLVIVS